MWAYLIKHGTTKEFSFYGGGFSMYCPGEVEAHLKKLREISRDGVDWKRTKEPHDDYQSEFTDTFSDAAYVKTFEGTLITKKGKKYNFGATWDEPKNVFVMFAELTNLEDFDEILKQKCLNKKEGK